ncbi:Nitrogen regulation protein NIFR3 (fragment) [Staphylococcus aureus]|uniref:Nitrogen regulation protein NIFR3 n=1 Tax=Staphylococcus aureus TaxID=1280 RepID=A0A0U1MG46_STAAU
MGPNKEADVKSAYNNVQVGGGAPTQRISKRNSTGNASWGGTTIKKYFFYRN